jgi:crossover junction endodeoxyribonuclease RusA
MSNVQQRSTQPTLSRAQKSLHVIIPGTPVRAMTPNGRAHWGTKAKLVKQAKADAHYATIQALREHDGIGLDCALAAATEIKVAVVIRFEPGRKRFDDDNAIASTKSYLDGVASGIGRDDKVFRLLSVKQEVDPDGVGHVAVTLVPVGVREQAA